MAVNFQLAQRPGFCTSGTVYEAFVNAFEVTSFPKVTFFHYDVIDPTPSNPKLATRIFHRLQHHTAPTIFSQIVTVFDGKKNMFSQGRPLFQEGVMTFNVNMSDNPPAVPNPRGLYMVQLSSVAEITPNDLVHVLRGNGSAMPTTTTPLQVLNLLVQQAAAVSFPLHTKQRYFTRDGHTSSGGLEIWRGFFASIRPTPGRLLINVDMSTGVMYQHGPLIDFILAYFNLSNVQMLNDLNEGHAKWTRVKGLLKGVQVETAPKGRLRTIRTIVENAGDYEFEVDDGQSKTVRKYFLERYNIHLRYPHIPGICTSRGEVIPFELCKIKQGQLFKKKTSPEVTSQVLNFAKKNPTQRLDIVRAGMQNMQLKESPFILQAGIGISSDPMQVHGRVLRPPAMIYGEGMKEFPKSGSWNMLRKRLLKPENIPTWAVVCFENVKTDEIKRFILGLKDAMEAVGMNPMSAPNPVEIINPYQITKDLRRVVGEVKKNTGNPPTLLIAILPKIAAPIRKEVKQYGDVLEGVVTQCVRVDKMLSASNQYYNNLILKINAKLGGINTKPSDDHPSFKWFSDGKTMVVGADVTHPGPGVLRPSVAALVASIDEGAAKYISRCAVQGPRTEIIQDLEELMSYALGMFYKYRKYLSGRLRGVDVPLLPEKIIFYRDGVSEGEIREVVENEIEQVMKAIEKVYSDKGAPFRAKLTFVVVGKRHHFRFFPKQAGDADSRSGNAPAGLLVDQGITAPGIFDFYLLSHAGLLGTSRPTHYIVVKDDNNFDANTLQGFSFDLCHTYARATRSVSIPAPCYYADIACSRADFHFDPTLNYDDDLSSTGGEFNLNPWIQGFRNVHHLQSTNMYFM